MTDPNHGLPDPECAGMLRRLAEAPRQAIIWPMYHGAWSGNTIEAFQHGATAMDASGGPDQAAALRELAANPGEAVGVVTETSAWPSGLARHLLDAAEALERGEPAVVG